MVSHSKHWQDQAILKKKMNTNKFKIQVKNEVTLKAAFLTTQGKSRRQHLVLPSSILQKARITHI